VDKQSLNSYKSVHVVFDGQTSAHFLIDFFLQYSLLGFSNYFLHAFLAALLEMLVIGVVWHY